MAEPTTTAIMSGIGASAITLTGSILGMQYDALTIALFGGVAALMHLPPIDGHFQKFSSVVTASIIGGVFTPVATPAILSYVHVLDSVDPNSIRLACAFVIGLTCQVVIPTLFSFIKRKGETA